MTSYLPNLSSQFPWLSPQPLTAFPSFLVFPLCPLTFPLFSSPPPPTLPCPHLLSLVHSFISVPSIFSYFVLASCPLIFPSSSSLAPPILPSLSFSLCLFSLPSLLHVLSPLAVTLLFSLSLHSTFSLSHCFSPLNMLLSLPFFLLISPSLLYHHSVTSHLTPDYIAFTLIFSFFPLSFLSSIAPLLPLLLLQLVLSFLISISYLWTQSFYFFFSTFCFLFILLFPHFPVFSSSALISLFINSFFPPLTPALSFSIPLISLDLSFLLLLLVEVFLIAFLILLYSPLFFLSIFALPPHPIPSPSP